MADLDLEVEAAGDAGASLTFPCQCSALRKGGYVNIKGFPCKVVNMSTSKTGKHGHAKVNLTAVDIFTGKKYEDVVPSTHNVEVPHVRRTEYTLVDIQDDFLSLMNESGDMKEDLKVPEDEVGEQIRALFDEGKELMITVQGAMEIEKAIQFKESRVAE
jgi:translation initiation factor 5A